MGGVIILASVAVTSLIYVKDLPPDHSVLFPSWFGLIVFSDDYLKVVMKRSEGLYPMQKMALQIVVTAIFAYYLVKVAKVPLTRSFRYARVRTESWMACNSGTVSCSDRYCEWYEFYRRMTDLPPASQYWFATFFTVVAV